MQVPVTSKDMERDRLVREMYGEAERADVKNEAAEATKFQLLWFYLVYIELFYQFMFITLFEDKIRYLRSISFIKF